MKMELTSVQKVQLREMWREGKSLDVIAEHFRVSKSTVTRWRREYELPTRQRFGMMPRHQVIALEMWDAGKTTREISDALGFSMGTVRKALKKRGVYTGRRRVHLARVHGARITEMRKAGASVVEIANELGLTRDMVSDIEAGLGFPKRKAPRAKAKRRQAPKIKIRLPKFEVIPEPKKSPARAKNFRHARQLAEVDGHPFYSERRDLAIARTAGAHAEIVKLAERWGKPIQGVQQRFHSLRAAGLVEFVEEMENAETV